MALTQNSTIDQITIETNGVILIRTSNIIMDGDKEIAQAYSRASLAPNQDLTGQPTNVVAIANLIWTPEIVSAYQKSLLTTTIG